MQRTHSVVVAAVAVALSASPALAQQPGIDRADTAWMIAATGLVLMMSIPGLALFYAGMVRKKNVLAAMAQTLAATMVVSILWMVAGYSLTFTGDGALIGSLGRVFLYGMTVDSVSPFAATIPESLFMLYQMTFAQLLAQAYGVVTTALWSGVMTVVILKVIALLVPLRVKREDEIMGLDVGRHGEALQ